LENLPSVATLTYVLRTSNEETIAAGLFDNVTSGSNLITGSAMWPSAMMIVGGLWAWARKLSTT
jgi:hypothetical protein